MVSRPRTTALFLMGPTAAGKTTAAVELVQRYPFEIISADSALVYRGLDIGSAKPDAATLAIAPHRLIDQVDPADAYSAGRFREDALLAMAEITAAGRIPLLVGGTGLYLRALDRGLARMPAADAAVRAQIDAQAAASGWPAMHQQLAQVDPAAAARIHPNDSQRIQRALEVFSISGQPISALQQQERSQACADTVYRVAWSRSRDQLNNNIEKRFKLMMENGFLSEVEALYRRGDLTTDHPAIRAVGYRQLWRHLDGEIDLGQAVQDAITATRRLAKRQLTWLRAEPGVVWLDPDSPSAAKRLNQIAARVVQSCRY